MPPAAPSLATTPSNSRTGRTPAPRLLGLALDSQRPRSSRSTTAPRNCGDRRREPMFALGLTGTQEVEHVADRSQR